VDLKQEKKQGFIFVVSGPSGSGKTTLASRVVTSKKLRGTLLKSVSLTTRPKRSGEREGRDYFFVSAGRFRRLLREKKILERTSYLGYDYATPKAFVERILKKGKHLILCLDVKGARALKRHYPAQTVTIFVKPPSIGTLRSRIEKRCARTTDREICGRLRRATAELRAAGKYDYCLLNKNLRQVVKALQDIIISKIKA
jgi:guanylate kinase